MSKKREWDFFDFFRGFKLAMTFEKIAWSFLGLFLAAGIFSLLSWLGTCFNALLSFQWVGLLGGLLLLFLWGGGIGRMVVSEERDDEELFMGETMDFIKANGLKILLIPVSFVAVFTALYFLLVLISGILGHLSAVGSWIFGALYFCWFGLGLVLFFFGVMAGLAMFVYPGISGTKSKGSLGDLLVSSVGILFPNLVKLSIYFVVTSLATLLIYSCIWCVATSGLTLAQSAMRTGGGEGYSKFTSAVVGSYYVVKNSQKDPEIAVFRPDELLDFYGPRQGDQAKNYWSSTRALAESQAAAPDSPLKKTMTDNVLKVLCSAPLRLLRMVGLYDLGFTYASTYVPATYDEDGVPQYGWAHSVGMGFGLGGLLALFSICLIFAAILAYPFSLFFTLGTISYLIAKGDDDDYEFDEKGDRDVKKEESKPACSCCEGEKKEGAC